MSRPFLSMCLIAKDEAHQIDRCFDSFWGAVDEIVLVDTGSTDGTVEKARQYAARKRGNSKLVIGHFDWSDDFAAARNHADSLASGEWVTWCDLDDEVVGLPQLREQAEQAPADVVAFFASYDYARDPHGNCLSELWRERMVRAGVADWTGRLHEHKLFTQGTIVRVDPQIARWVHHREHDPGGENTRNVGILEAWDRDEPGNPRVLSSLGLEYMGAQRHADAARMFAAYLACDGEPQDRRGQAARYLAVMLLQQGKVEDARQAALTALAEEWMWADTHLSLAECAQTLGRPQEGYLHAKQALELGKPDTLLIVNPLQYTAHPRAVMAVCMAQMGQFEQAVKLADETLEICPSYGLIVENAPLWRGALRTERTIAAFTSCAQVLAESGEIAKAETVLDQVPYFAHDDPRVVDRRAELDRLRRQAEDKPLVPLAHDAAGKCVLRQLAEVA